MSNLEEKKTEPSAIVPAQGEWITPGLIYRGPIPPKGDWSLSDWVEIPHEHYIPISQARLLKKIQELFNQRNEDPEKQAHFKQFLELVEAVYHFHFYKVLTELKEDYEYFSPDRGEELRQGVSEEELLFRERRFLANILLTMIRGNFIPYSEKYYKLSTEQSYLFDLEVKIPWELYDRRLIHGFLEYIDSPEGQELRKRLEFDGKVRDFLNLPSKFDDRIMLFFRGIGWDRTEGLFLLQKVDILIKKLFGLIIRPFQWVLEKVRKKKQPIPSSIDDITETITELGDQVVDGVADVASIFGINIKTEEEEKLQRVNGEDEERSVIFEKRWVRRVNLGNQNITIGSLFKKLELQEPTFERIICIFRLKPPKPPKFIDKFPLLKSLFNKIFKIKEDESIDRTIYLKTFKHIPFADSEIVFPEKKIGMKSLDIALLSLTGLLGLGILIKNLIHPPQNKAFFIVLMTVLGSYIVKLVLGYFRARTKYMAKMTRELYQKSLDNDLGVLQYLVDSIEEQEVKEAVLAYTFLLLYGPKTQKELDGLIEQFICDNFPGVEVDFEVDDALDKVIEKEEVPPELQTKYLPIVKVHPGAGPDGSDLYEAKPLLEALRIIDERWDNFFQYNV